MNAPCVPGGGANAVSNLADLGVNVLPVGVVGDDEPGRLLLKAFRHKHVAGERRFERQELHHRDQDPHSGWHRRTPARQQVVRVDREPEAEPNRPFET